MKTQNKSAPTIQASQKKDFDKMLQLGLKFSKNLTKMNTTKAAKCFEAIPVASFPEVYKPMASSIYRNFAWNLIVDRNSEPAESYLKRALEFGDYGVAIKLGHVKYLQNQLKESIDYYLQSADKLGFMEEIIMEIQDDFDFLKVSTQNFKNLSNFLTCYYRDKSTDFAQLCKAPDASTPELSTQQGYWKFSKKESCLLFSSADIRLSFYDGENRIDDFEQIRKHYAQQKESIEVHTIQIMNEQNKKLLCDILTEARLDDESWAWENWSLYNSIQEQDAETDDDFYECAEIKVDRSSLAIVKMQG